MSQPVIANPILNSPYREPRRHFKFSDEGITDEIVEQRRPSSYFVPIPAPKRRGKQTVFETEWTRDRVEESKFINDVRRRVGRWRLAGRAGTTRTTRRLLDYWSDEARERPLFFCQVEALETAIYITEVAHKDNAGWIEQELRRLNDDANPGLYRVAFKMATGTGKTVVMAMLIAWQALNKLANPQDRRFSDAFLVVTPGITIKDRLRVLLPNDPGNYYRERDLLPPDLVNELGKAKIVITNFHAFKARELSAAGKLGKHILGAETSGAFTESPDQMVRRVCRSLGTKKSVVVLNDEAHHCYRGRPAGEFEDGARLKGDLRREAQTRAEEARVWISGLEAVTKKLGTKVVYDLSATPFFLRGSGYPEGKLFPWVVSDFSLVDAIESGVVKVPRVPVADDAMTGESPTYRDLWPRIRDELPKRGRGTDGLTGPPTLPPELEGALHSLYANYKKYFALWEADTEGRARGRTPPVFIVVCNNTSVSKLVFDYVAGWAKPLPDGGSAVVPGRLDLFSNERAGVWSERPNTILVDSLQLESGDAMSDQFKKVARTQIEEFKAEYRQRFPGRDAEDLTDEDLLREVMNTVGKPDKLGDRVRCVVSVSMLTEGWDATTVTHILGIRAFSTQLLCEQVVGRALRRTSYVAGEDGLFSPEYAEVYGVPFSFIPTTGTAVDPPPPAVPTRVRALEERSALEIRFPRLEGYRYELPSERLTASFNEDSDMALSTRDVPTRTQVAPIIGEGGEHTLDELRARRPQEVAFALARDVLERHLSDDGNVKPWLFPQLLAIARRWLDECLTLGDDAFPQLLLFVRYGHDAADRIYKAIVASQPAGKRLQPRLRQYDPEGSTTWVDFDTVKTTYATAPDKCHVSHVAEDSGWESKLAQSLEDMDEVVAYVKNQGFGFTIPYTIDGEERQYWPDFIVRLRDGADDEPLNLVVEVSGQAKRDKKAKVTTARELWVPAVNNHGGFGRWAFVEVTDPWDAKGVISAAAAGAESLVSEGV
ncbi:DEAD/DEAH box helicase family protein [soil metagenome]